MGVDYTSKILDSSPEPGEITDETLGVDHLGAGSPVLEPPEYDQMIGDAEYAEGDGDELKEA